MSFDLHVNMEPLPGYRLIERLGTGGYGEVWRAEAPGGLVKAIKFVFGKHDEKWASHELRALERVRAVRHPFMLSLERIEVADGRLLVVSELADGSVKGRHEQYRKQGQPGIPRNELVGYLRDAADALDFMSEVHSLQHLDIKPENLLLLAGHVKVADFGLVKDVRDSQASFISGMTPLYAAPEVFRGAPSSRSDQYSLAIVYQEMLTGTLPFAGMNANELTLQHLNDEPDLSTLTPGDRYVVSRALAKEPPHRYATCREFVDSLARVATADTVAVGRKPAAGTFVALSQFAEPLPAVNRPTDLFDDDDSAAWGGQPDQRLIELPPPDGRLIDLPPVDLRDHDFQSTPTLILGVGGAAGLVLRQFRRMLGEQYGDPGALSAVRLLLVDTDAKSLAEVSRCERGLSPEETLNLPLRRPQHYRGQSQFLLQWLNRRWLYNIPRSLRTEGLRPLGRLALVDGARQTGQRIRRAIAEAIDGQAPTRSAPAGSRECRENLVQVFVVASISGGTGSGMSLDLGYIVRAVLEKLAVTRSNITGVMMHATGGDPRRCELARVNAFSWLTEFHHFQQPENRYPGDASCGLPAHEPGLPPFDQTYLVHLGEQLDTVEYDRATEAVAAYLQLNVATEASAFFEVCRDDTELAARTYAAARNTVRSFGIYRRFAEEDPTGNYLADEVSQRVMLRWLNSDLLNENNDVPTHAPAEAECPGADRLVARLHLTAQQAATRLRSEVYKRLYTDVDSFLWSWLSKNCATAVVSDYDRYQAIDRLFSLPAPGVATSLPDALLGEPVAALTQPLEGQLRSEIRRWVNDMVDDPRERAVGAERAAARLGHHLRGMAADLAHFHRTVAGKIGDLLESIGSAAQEPHNERAKHYFRLRLDQLALAVATHMTGQIAADIDLLHNDLTAFRREVEQLMATTRRAAASPARQSWDSDEADVRLPANHRPGIDSRLAELVEAVERRLQRQFLAEHGGLMQTVLQGGRTRAQLVAKLHEYSQRAVASALAGAHVVDELLAGRREGESELRSALAAATPSLVEHGGTRRVLAVVPRAAAEAISADDMTQSIGTAATTLAGTDNGLILCVETDQTPITYVAVEFIQGRRDRADFAERVHSRTDVLWTPLLPASTLSGECPWDDDSIKQPVSAETAKTVVM